MNISPGAPFPLGVCRISQTCLNISVIMPECKECGIILYQKKTDQLKKIYFDQSYSTGTVYSIKISGFPYRQYEYNFFYDDTVFTDSYAKAVAGNEKYGAVSEGLRGIFVNHAFDWNNDRNPMIPYEKSVFYLLHVRGFTRHVSSHVKNRGCFSAITDKIPYLKELGITTIELMPAYEFEETEKLAPVISYQKKEESEYRINYWGYKDAYYFAPKYSYSYSSKNKDCLIAFKTMIYKLHESNLECIMQFYFPDDKRQDYILDVLRYWVCEFHVDGFHILGSRIPVALISEDALLSKTKLIFDNDLSQTQLVKNNSGVFQNLAQARDDFMYDIRRFLKSDEGMIHSVIHHIIDVSKNHASIHYVTQCNGFTLQDLVSFDRKHNEINHEKNMDGVTYNCSWNCGVEGNTRRADILQIRRKQIRNALIFNLLSQNTPLLLSGDEFCNSQKGNNNPYCIDSPVTWLNWNDQKKNEEIFDFLKQLISFRKEHLELQRNKPFTMIDSSSCGYPDLSLHGEEAWKLQADNLTRHFGIMYCSFNKKKKANTGSFLFLAINMHWTSHSFALPQLPPDMKWNILFDTAKDGTVHKKSLVKQNEISVEDRSIKILVGELQHAKKNTSL